MTRKQAITGAELQRLRERAGMTSWEVAALLGFHPNSVKYWERCDEVNPCGPTPKRILIAIGVDPEMIAPPLAHVWRVSLPFGDPEDAGESQGTTMQRPHSRARHGVLNEPVNKCGAKTRRGTPCAMTPEPGKRRCRLHGGRPTGPKTAEGKTRIAEALRRRRRRSVE